MPNLPPTDLLHTRARAPAPGLETAAERARPEPGLLLEASCRPHSWSLYGVHARFADEHGPWQRPGIEALAHAAASLRAAAGGARLWIPCAGGLPEDTCLALLAGRAALSGVGLQALGLSIPHHALPRLGPRERQAVLELRRSGLDVALNLELRPGRLEAADDGLAASVRRFEPVVEAAHALRMTVIAADVRTREQALELARIGVCAVAGPAVGPAMSLEQMQRFLGPREAGLERMRADSV